MTTKFNVHGCPASLATKFQTIIFLDVTPTKYAYLYIQSIK